MRSPSLPPFACLLLLTALLVAGCDNGGGIPDDLGDNTTFSFDAQRATVAEDSVETVTLMVVVDDPGYKELSVGLTFDAAQSTASVEDFVGLPTDTTFTFPRSTTSGDTRTVTFSIRGDDAPGEDQESAVFMLTNPRSGSVGEIGTFTLVLNDGSFPGPPDRP